MRPRHFIAGYVMAPLCFIGAGTFGFVAITEQRPDALIAATAMLACWLINLSLFLKGNADV